jgi:excisionase family DNA binding protein
VVPAVRSPPSPLGGPARGASTAIGPSGAAEPWVSVDDVAAHLGVRKDSIYRWIEHRALPAKKIGKLWKLKLSEVDDWVRTRGADDEPSKAGPTAVPPPSRPPVEHHGDDGPLVLVIDDEDLVRETVCEFLTDEGYGVSLACDGAEALTLLRSGAVRPALIILDLKMPNLDGWRFREEQAADPALAAIPVIVVTAAPSASVSGAAAILRKPLRLPLLGKAIARLLERRTEAAR